MTDNKEREFQKIKTYKSGEKELTNRDIAEDIIIEHCEKESFDDMRNAITNALNEAYAKGRQSVLGIITKDNEENNEMKYVLDCCHICDTPKKHSINKHWGVCSNNKCVNYCEDNASSSYIPFVNLRMLLSKLSDDKGG